MLICKKKSTGRVAKNPRRYCAQSFHSPIEKVELPHKFPCRSSTSTFVSCMVNLSHQVLGQPTLDAMMWTPSSRKCDPSTNPLSLFLGTVPSFLQSLLDGLPTLSFIFTNPMFFLTCACRIPNFSAGNICRCIFPCFIVF